MIAYDKIIMMCVKGKLLLDVPVRVYVYMSLPAYACVNAYV